MVNQYCGGAYHSSSLSLKWLEHEVHYLPYSDEVKNEWSSTNTLTCLGTVTMLPLLLLLAVIYNVL